MHMQEAVTSHCSCLAARSQAHIATSVHAALGLLRWQRRLHTQNSHQTSADGQCKRRMVQPVKEFRNGMVSSLHEAFRLATHWAEESTLRVN